MSLIISLVHIHSNLISLFSILLWTKKYLMDICLVASEFGCPLLANWIVLLLSCLMVAGPISLYPCDKIKFLNQIMCPKLSLIPINSASVLDLQFIFWELLFEHMGPEPKPTVYPVWLLILVCTPYDASTNAMINNDFPTSNFIPKSTIFPVIFAVLCRNIDVESYLLEIIFARCCNVMSTSAVALHSLYLRTVRSRTLQVRLLFSTTHYYPWRT